MMNINAISENICGQIVKLQASIASREDGCPTLQEIEMQVKLINSLDKLSRFAARQAKEEARKQAELATQSQPPAPQPDFVYDDPPPVTSADTVEFSYAVDEVSAQNTEVTYKGQVVRVDWLMYNLFQFTLPVLERRFVADPAAMFGNDDSAKNQAA